MVSPGDDSGSGGYWGVIHAKFCWIQTGSGIDLDLGGACEDKTPGTVDPYLSGTWSDPHPAGFDYGDVYGGGYAHTFGWGENSFRKIKADKK